MGGFGASGSLLAAAVLCGLVWYRFCEFWFRIIYLGCGGADLLFGMSCLLFGFAFALVGWLLGGSWVCLGGWVWCFLLRFDIVVVL